ncbi:MAG: LLM class flavin-dependent oxidoreductase [Candidatus Rokubacteria bacterium]|nr:LLM class flavin-dependent oxidoreductase [Candidatus Rokubacteria bacterium]
MDHGFALFAATAPEIIRACAREAEALGYRSFWVNHPGKTDGLASLAHAAAETARVDLGVGVIPLNTRGPESIIEGVKAQKLPLPRLLLGVGSPNPGSLQRVRDGVAALKAAFQTRVIIAALGPKMCHLAGEVADGVLFNFITPAHAKKSVEMVKAGAAAAQRQPPRMSSYVRLSLGAAALPNMQAEADRYGAIPAYAANFERMGVKPIETTIAASTEADIKAAIGTWQASGVDELIFRAIVATDTAEENLKLVRAAKPS